MHLAAIIILHLAFQGHLPPSTDIGCLRAECTHSWPNPQGSASASSPGCQSIDSPTDPSHPVSPLTLALLMHSGGESLSPAPGSGVWMPLPRVGRCSGAAGLKQRPSHAPGSACQHLPGGAPAQVRQAQGQGGGQGHTHG